MRGKRRGFSLTGRGRAGSAVAWTCVACSFLLLLSIALPLMGCGGGEEEAAPLEETVEELPAEGGETVKPETTMEEGEEEESEVPESGGATEFELENQSIGSGAIATNLDLVDVYWQDHGDFFRIVFEYRRKDGKEPDKVPHVSTIYGGTPGNEEYWNINIQLTDITLDDMKATAFAAEGVPVSLGNPIVKTMERVPTADTESVVFLVKCNYNPAHPGISSRPHRLRYQTHPMRVMVDILKY